MLQTRLFGKIKPHAAQVQPSVRAIVETVVRDEFGDTEFDDPTVLDYTVEVMLKKLDLMPGFLSVGMVFATAFFERAAVARRGRPFHKLEHEARSAHLASFKTAPISLLRDFTDFYTKMGIFVYCSRLEELEPARFGADKHRG